MFIVAPLLLMAGSLASGPQLGLVMGIPDGAGEKEYLAAMRQQIRLGLDGNAFNLKWDEFEAQAEKPLVDAVNMSKFTAQDIILTVGTIDTVKRRLPTDVAELRWNDPRMLSRFDAFLGKVKQLGGSSITAISLGNEVNVYLESHPDEVDDYCDFLKHSQQTIARLFPKVPVGVTITCMDAMRKPDLATKLQGSLPAAFFTYYPVAGLKVSDPSATKAHFEFMLRTTGSRPVYLQEVGYPTSELLGSSEAKQAEFVRQVFVELDRHRDRVVFASYFMQMDLTKSLVEVFKTYYGISDPTFLSFLSTLGLCDPVGKPKLGWKVFCDSVMARRPITGSR